LGTIRQIWKTGKKYQPGNIYKGVANRSTGSPITGGYFNCHFNEKLIINWQLKFFTF
jgi:hypothetical protein